MFSLIACVSDVQLEPVFILTQKFLITAFCKVFVRQLIDYKIHIHYSHLLVILTLIIRSLSHRNRATLHII